jgi:1-deoxy-D-xylulose-5-phosphate synthase
VTPLDRAMLADAARHPLVLVAEDGVAEGGVGALVAAALVASSGVGSPAVLSAGVPLAYLPHGRAADILADLGLDGTGIARRVLRHLAATAPGVLEAS